MNILGINSAYHENSAALIVDGQVRCAVEEERFNRIKHGAEARVDNPHELPVQSIQHCLAQGQLQPNDLDAICFSFDPELRRQGWQPDPYAQANDWGHPVGEAIFYQALQKVPAALSALLGFDVTPIFHWVPHHVAHAASAYYPSTFDPAGILVIDGIGEDATALLAYGSGTTIETLQRIPMPHSLGFLWEKLSKFLGFSEYDASKVMGLAGYGNPLTYKAQFDAFLQVHRDGTFQIDDQILQFRQPNFDSLHALFGTIDDVDEPGHRQKGRDIAATLQMVTNDIMLALAHTLYAQHPCDALCIAGGVALNCTSNWLVKEQGPYQRIYIPSAPNDAGTAIGAALYHYYNPPVSPTSSQPKPTRATEVMPHPYTGPSYTNAEIQQLLQAQPRPYRKAANVALEAAEMIASGKIVAWFQGPMELGPRALGNRSLLADPRDANMREVLNRKVKHREIFRPFAPSVLEEFADDWFVMGKFSESYRYMLYACPVHEEKMNQIPAVVHIDDTARIQTVARRVNPKYHQLIAHFYAITGVPLVLNTSFNDSEPIVCTPQDALNTFNKTQIDVLVLGDYIVERLPVAQENGAAKVRAPHSNPALEPVLSAD
ncbi:MAG: hypothetical protein KF832_23305 [Caldilineaceae bacterium]|nr:hypothetical protein [Caldilineaceae bacterium]